MADSLIDKLIVPFFGLNKHNHIFYTSKRVTGIKASLNWKVKIKSSIKNCKYFIALITPNYKESEMCIGEIGAAWVLGKKIYPLIIPPITFENFSVIISDLQAEDLSKTDNVKSFVDSLKSDLSSTFYLNNLSELEEKEIIKKFGKSLRSYLRKKPFEKFEKVIEEKKAPISVNIKKESSYETTESLIDTSEEINKILKLSKIEWPDDYEMQLHYINKQKSALKKLDRILENTSNTELTNILFEKAKKEWPDDYVMQVHTLEKQLDSYRQIRKNNR
jgi:gas vesicle protein